MRARTGDVHAAAPDVVNMESQKRSFWKQLTGSLDAGISFTSGNDQKQTIQTPASSQAPQVTMSGCDLQSKEFVIVRSLGVPLADLLAVEEVSDPPTNDGSTVGDPLHKIFR